MNNKNKVWIYNADIIIEFLNKTLAPTSYFLKQLHKTGPEPLLKTDFIEGYESKSMDLDEIYKFYLLFREQVDYTADIESRYKFSVIIGKLLYYKNGWEFTRKRRGRNQIKSFYPAMLKTSMDPVTLSELRKKPLQAPKSYNVDLSIEDYSSTGVDLADGVDETVWTEVFNRWIEII